jgi:hypothetical protein
VLSCGKPFQAIASIFLRLSFWVPGVIHAMLVVHSYHEDLRTQRVVRAIERGGVMKLAN